MAVAPSQRGDPPDGGYAWVILVAHAINTVFAIQMHSMIGFVFKDVFSELDMPATDVAIILNLHVSFSLLLGIFTGALIRRFGYRCVAAAGALLACVGLLLTAVSNTFLEFVVNFSIITSAGVGLTTPSFSVAFHSYFRRRRSLATGVCAAIMGVAGIVSPQVIGLLLHEYGPRGTCVLLAGYALNVVAAAALLQPVGWHCRRRAATDNPNAKELMEDDEEESVRSEDFPLPPLPVLKEETDAEVRRELLGVELYGSLGSMRRRASTVTMSSYYTARRPSESSNTMWASASVLDLVCSRPGLDQPLGLAPPLPTGSSPRLDKSQSKERLSGAGEPLPMPRALRAPRCLGSDVRRCGRFLVDFFDLGLLASPSISNVMVGLALALFAEGNFARFLPFIFAERGLSTPRIANILSLMAVADTVCKLLAPLLHGLLRQSSRVMCLAFLALLAAGRTALVLVRDDVMVLVVAVTLGSFKGFRIVFHAQVVPDSVPPERLAAGIGLQAVLSGVVVLLFGPLIGVIRDQSGSYDMVIMACNAFTLACIAMWLVEFISTAVKARGRGRDRGQGGIGA